ncbi:hypothetical protein BS78_01G400000 [Paspalum vaginatum]|nr:hypothetical protein BS78_01G400000 [Paspalum vaginatum]
MSKPSAMWKKPRRPPAGLSTAKPRCSKLPFLFRQLLDREKSSLACGPWSRCRAGHCTPPAYRDDNDAAACLPLALPEDKSEGGRRAAATGCVASSERRHATPLAVAVESTGIVSAKCLEIHFLPESRWILSFASSF